MLSFTSIWIVIVPLNNSVVVIISVVYFITQGRPAAFMLDSKTSEKQVLVREKLNCDLGSVRPEMRYFLQGQGRRRF